MEGRSYYKRFYRLVSVAVAVMTAVITGSLVLGDSVRGSLVERVNERLGPTETIIQTGTGFLRDTVLHHPLLANAHGYLLAEGFVSSNGQMIPVTVWGTDADEAPLQRGEAFVNEELAKHLSQHTPPTVVLHLPSSNLIPSSSLFVSQRYANQLRLRVQDVKSGQDGGNLMLRNEQVRPLNIFVNRQELAEALGVEGKVNLILSSDHISSDDFSRICRPGDFGLFFEDSIVGTDRVFLTKALVDSLKPKARYLAYFVNSLGTIPYSFVTATDQLHGDETVLSDYAARRLNARVGDSVTMEYYVSRGELKQLATRSHRFCVSRIVPIAELQAQASLITADFPGLSGVERCTDWDSDLPLDMSRIKKVDEDYWTQYRQTPKALVSLDAVGQDWTGYFGVATKVVIDTPLVTIGGSFGASVLHPRTLALHAAQNGTDFGVLFLALGFFIVVSAILLMQNPLSEMYHLRRPEIALYSVLGFSRRQVFRRLFGEALPAVLWATPVGLLMGYAYAALILWLLGGPWSGATHTDGFALHASHLTVVLSLLVAVAVAVGCMAWSVNRGVNHSTLHTPHATRHESLHTPHFTLLEITGLSLCYYRRQHRLSFWTMALGVFTVFAVGLNRPDSNHSSGEATGGYQYYGESRIPIQYDLNSAEARHHLHLDALPDDVRFLQMPKHTEDEASCLNLNKVETPSVLGMDLKAMGDFGIDTTKMKGAQAAAELANTLVKVAVDQEALMWGMMRNVGDTLTYHASDGRAVQAVIVATYPTGVFHGNAIMSMDSYRQLWPDEMGTRVMLVRSSVPEKGTPEGKAKEGLAGAVKRTLSDYGLTLTTTADRMRLFFEVTDTYLGIFLSLGGLGLLLGLASLLIFIRKNLAARRDEIRLYRTLGFADAAIIRMLRREQLVVPVLAILAGAVGCVVVSLILSVTTLLSPFTSLSPFITALVLFLLILLFTRILIYYSINSKTFKQCET